MAAQRSQEFIFSAWGVSVDVGMRASRERIVLFLPTSTHRVYPDNEQSKQNIHLSIIESKDPFKERVIEESFFTAWRTCLSKQIPGLSFWVQMFYRRSHFMAVLLVIDLKVLTILFSFIGLKITMFLGAQTYVLTQKKLSAD